MMLAMTKIMFQIIALSFEHIVIFVFRLPARPSRRGNLGDIITVNAMVYNRRIVVDLRVHNPACHVRLGA